MSNKMKPGIELDIKISEEVLNEPIWIIYEKDGKVLCPADIYCHRREEAEEIVDKNDQFVLVSPNPEFYSTNIELAMDMAEELELFDKCYISKDSNGYFAEDFKSHVIVDEAESLAHLLCLLALKVGK